MSFAVSCREVAMKPISATMLLYQSPQKQQLGMAPTAHKQCQKPDVDSYLGQTQLQYDTTGAI